jgi:hypothetical protein
MTAISPAAEPHNGGRHGRRLAVLGSALATLAVGAALVAPSADAALQRCSSLGFEGSDANALCARVTGIDPGSYLGARTAPSRRARIVNRFHNRDIVEVDCWATGDPDAEGHGDRYWAGLYGPAGPTYVNDWYVTTGRPSVWTRQVPHC